MIVTAMDYYKQKQEKQMNQWCIQIKGSSYKEMKVKTDICYSWEIAESLISFIYNSDKNKWFDGGLPHTAQPFLTLFNTPRWNSARLVRITHNTLLDYNKLLRERTWQHAYETKYANTIRIKINAKNIQSKARYPNDRSHT
jgi:hypothetical protein